MVTKQQLSELKHNIKTMEEWELFEWVSGYKLQPEQLKIWKDSQDEKVRRQNILAHRGWGKSWLEGAHRFIKMITIPEWESYTVYPKREQAMYSLGYTKAFIQSNPYTNWMSKQAINWGETKIMLPNKSFSFIISPSSRTATGYHVDQGYCGEAARWADDWDEIYYSAIVPMTNRKKGLIWQTSSAYGERGFFHKEHIMGNTPERKVYVVDVYNSGVYDADDINTFRNDLGEMLFKQEYECQFVGSAETFIKLYIITKQQRQINQISWSDLVSGKDKIDYLGMDPGKSIDKFGLCGIKRVGTNRNQIVLYEEFQNEAYEVMASQIQKVQKMNPRMKIFMESTGNQIMYLDWLKSLGVRVQGEEFGNNNKEELYKRLERNLRNGYLEIPSNNDLCMSQLKYIPYQLKGTHIHFPDEKIGGHHSLHALVVINLGLGNGNGLFGIRSL